MALLQNDPITQLAFSIYENKGVFAVLLGSGLSRAAEIPTGWEITLDLVRRVATAQGIDSQSDWAKWYRNTTGTEPNYSTLLEDIAISPDERRAILHSYIEPNENDRETGRKTPTKAHHAIAKLVQAGYIKVIITTNFDRLMENALREYGIEPTVVASEDSLAGAEPLTHSRCYILKLHGDYKDARILNTDQELSAYPAKYDQILDRIFDEHGLIICGWSGEWDHALRAAFLRAPNRRYPVFWATHGSPGAGASELIAHKAAKTIPINGADQLFVELQLKVETLGQSQLQNPNSVELLVSSAKRYLAKHEYRIQLDELFSQETERLLKQLDDTAFSAKEQWSPDQFTARIKRYQSMTEPLAKMAGVLGRWGDGNDIQVVLDVIRNVFHQSGTEQNGLKVWLDIRSYPAVLVLTAYGIGLTKSERWDSLLKLFTATFSAEYRDPLPLVSMLFLGEWRGCIRDYWKNLDGYQNRKTPLSDHLLETMTTWSRSFIGASPLFELLFERFEIMGSLAAFHEYSEAQLLAASQTTNAHQKEPVLIPFGRSIWNTSVSNILLKELEDPTKNTGLLNAGFAKGSATFLKLFIENFNQLQRQSRFW